LPLWGVGVNGPLKVADRLRGVMGGTGNLAVETGVGSASSTESNGADFIKIGGGLLRPSEGDDIRAVVGRDSVEVPGRANL